MSLTISAGQVAAFIANPTSFAGYSSGGYVKIDGAIDYSVASSLNAVPATYIEASILETTAANLIGIAVNNSTRNTLNKFSFALSETAATAAELNSIVAKTSIAPDFSKITLIEASDAAAIKTLYTSTTTGLQDGEAIKVNDTAISAKDLTTINGYTTGLVTPTAATSITGEVADVKSFLDTLNAQVTANPSQLGITLTNWDHNGNGTANSPATTLPITITDTNVDAAKLLAVVDHANHNALVTVASSATTLSGPKANIASLYLAGSTKVAGLGALNLVPSETSITSSDQASLAGNTTGKITATIAQTDFAANPNLTALVGTGHDLTITVTDTAASAAELKALDAVTTKAIDLSTIATIEASTPADIVTVLNSAGFSAFKSDVAIISTTGATSVGQANIMDAKTTGAVTATIATGDMASLNTLTGTGNNYTTTITDANVLAADLNALNAKTNVVINASNVQQITGSLADLTKFYTDAAKIVGGGNNAKTDFTASTTHTINITDTIVDAASLTSIREATNTVGTTGTVNLTNITTLKGTSAEVETALGLISGTNVVGLPANIAVTVSEANVNADNLVDISALTSGLITIDTSVATKITGSTIAETTSALKLSKLVADATADTTGVETVRVTGVNGLPVTITAAIATNTAVADADKVKTDYPSIGALTATVKPGNAAAAVSTFVTSTHANYIKPGSTYNIAAVQGTAAASLTGGTPAKSGFSKENLADVITLGANTSGTIELVDHSTGDPQLDGSVAQVVNIFTSKLADGTTAKYTNFASSVINLNNAAGTIVNASDLKTIADGTDKLVTFANNNVILSGSAATLHTLLDLKSAETAGNDKIHFGADAPSNPIIINDQVTTLADIDAIIDRLASVAGGGNAYAAPLTSGTVTVVSPSISGKITDVTTVITKFQGTAKLSGLSDVNIVATGNDTEAANLFSNVKAAEAKTTGVITMTMKDSEGVAELLAADLADTNTRVKHNLSFTTNGTAINAATLKAADAMTNGTIDATDATSITGTAADIISVYDSTGIINLGPAESVVFTDNPTVTQLNTVLGKTTAPVTGSISATMADLNGLAETGNNLTISVTGNYTTSELTALSAKTIGTITTNSGTTLTGTYADVLAAANGVGFDGATNVTVTDPVTAAQIYTLQGKVTSGVVTATISDTSASVLLANNASPRRAGAFTITVANTSPAVSTDNATDAATKASVSVANITSIEALTTEVLNVTSPELRGAIAGTVTLFNKNTPDDSTVTKSISGLETIAVTTSDDVTVDQLNKITSKTSGLVTSTTTEASTIDQYVNATTGALLIESGNAITVDLDGNAKASELITLDAATTGVVNLVDAQNTITGSIAEIKTLFATADTTTGVATGAHTIKGIGNAHVILTDSGTVQASEIIAVDALTSGNITIPNTIATIEGVYADVDKVVAMDAGTGIAAGTLVNRNPHGGTPPDYISTAINITDSVTVAEANKIVVAMAQGVVTATISDGDIATLLTTANTTNQLGLNQVDGGASKAGQKLSVTLTESSVNDAQLLELATRTAGTVTVSSSTTLTGDFTNATALSNLKTVLEDTTITGISKVKSTAAATAAQVNEIIARTTGVVDATISQNGIADLNTLTGSGNALTITVNTASLDAAALNALNNKTTVAVTVDPATTIITGALSDIKAAYDANEAGTIIGLGNEVVVVGDSGSIAASDLNSVNALTTGAIGASSVKTVTGSIADLLKVYSPSNSAGAIGGLGDEAIIVTDSGTVAATDISSLDSATTGSITATGVTKLTGSVTEITAARAGAVLTGLTNIALTGATETFDALNYLASNADLITAFGNVPSSAITHYLAFGVNESRNLDSFDEKSYLASHADLLTAFGSDATKALTHYISNGFSENRAVDTFDELGYVASYKDLITAIGDNAAAAVDHYINFGYGENRTSTFDASSYLSANADLSAAFGSDLELAKKHYINHGVNENRALA